MRLLWRKRRSIDLNFQVPKLDKSFTRLEIPGLVNFSNAQVGYAKVCWLVLISIFGACMFYEIFRTVQDYVEMPVKTVYMTRAETNMEIPDVVICPPYKITNAYLKGFERNVKLAAAANRILGLNFIMREAHLDELNLNFTDEEEANRFNRTLSKIDAIELIRLLIEMRGKSDFFRQCIFREYLAHMLNCSYTAKPIYDEEWGICFLIRSLTYRQIIPAQGLILFINASRDEFVQEPAYFEAPKFRGLSVGVGSKIDLTGFSNMMLISMGTYAKLELREHRSEFWNETLECRKNDEFNFTVLSANYSRQACRIDCFLKRFLDKCKCLPAVDEEFLQNSTLLTYPYCSVEQVRNCTSGKDYSIVTDSRYQSCISACITACLRRDFECRITTTDVSLDDFIQDQKAARNIAKDFVVLQISHTYLSHEDFAPSWPLALDDVISNCGGQINLWLGMSMFTIIQIPSIILVCCWHRFFRGRSQ